MKNSYRPKDDRRPGWAYPLDGSPPVELELAPPLTPEQEARQKAYQSHAVGLLIRTFALLVSWLLACAAAYALCASPEKGPHRLLWCAALFVSGHVFLSSLRWARVHKDEMDRLHPRSKPSLAETMRDPDHMTGDDAH